MLAEAVRNTQPQPVPNVQRDRSETPTPRLSATHDPARRDPHRSSRPKSKTFGHLVAASRGLDSAGRDPLRAALLLKGVR